MHISLSLSQQQGIAVVNNYVYDPFFTWKALLGITYFSFFSDTKGGSVNP